MPGFEFQRLRVFDVAADAATEVNGIAWRIPLRYRAMRDQVSRSSISVPLNIAEGADEFSVPEKVRFYRMARRSAAETAGALTLLVRFGVFLPNEVQRAMKLLNQAAAMLTAMMTRLEQSGAARKRHAPPAERRQADPSREGGRVRTGPGPGAGPRPASPQ